MNLLIRYCCIYMHLSWLNISIEGSLVVDIVLKVVLDILVVAADQILVVVEGSLVVDTAVVGRLDNLEVDLKVDIALVEDIVLVVDIVLMVVLDSLVVVVLLDSLEVDLDSLEVAIGTAVAVVGHKLLLAELA